MSPEQKAAYIAAFIDGEGGIYCYDKETGYASIQRGILFSNTERHLIDTVKSFLFDLGFKTSEYPRIYHTGRKCCWTVRIIGGRTAFEQFKAAIPIQHPGKVAALNKILGSYTDRVVIIRTCETCGTEFVPKWWPATKARYCSGRCRGKAQSFRLRGLAKSAGEAAGKVHTAKRLARTI